MKGLLAILFVLFVLVARAATEKESQDSDVPQADSVVAKPNLYQKIVKYLAETNSTKTDTKFDFSVIGGPHYSSDTKFGLGIVAAGYYNTDPTDTLTHDSNVSLYGDITTTLYYEVGIRGSNLCHGDAWRIDYVARFFSFPSYFWGIGYDMDHLDKNKTKYKRLQSDVNAVVLRRVGKYLYMGPLGSFSYVKAGAPHDRAMWEGQKLRTFNWGPGVSVQFDTRDNIANAYRGTYVKLDQTFYPKFAGNDYAFSMTEITANQYCRAWKGAIIACQVHGKFTYGNVPWSQLAQVGGSRTLRGYYEGRYCDKEEIDFVVELRQHVYHRSGFVLWGGAGWVMPYPSAMRLRETLPSVGVGYRWEFKKRVNVRLDYGIGRGESAILFSINEAF
ncbi:MAG: BamA/TamA family outer membrane protein [Bacteroidales bacterium]|nr:BamA/TamA family outer membrane protein [Bacteroidales bacterium]